MADTSNKKNGFQVGEAIICTDVRTSEEKDLLIVIGLRKEKNLMDITDGKRAYVVSKERYRKLTQAEKRKNDFKELFVKPIGFELNV